MRVYVIYSIRLKSHFSKYKHFLSKLLCIIPPGAHIFAFLLCFTIDFFISSIYNNIK